MYKLNLVGFFFLLLNLENVDAQETLSIKE